MESAKSVITQLKLTIRKFGYSAASKTDELAFVTTRKSMNPSFWKRVAELGGIEIWQLSTNFGCPKCFQNLGNILWGQLHHFDPWSWCTASSNSRQHTSAARSNGRIFVKYARIQILHFGQFWSPRVFSANYTTFSKSRRFLTLINAFLRLRHKKEWDRKNSTFQHPSPDLAVEDLRDLLLTTIQNTVSLNDLVTQLTQEIVNTMLS